MVGVSDINIPNYKSSNYSFVIIGKSFCYISKNEFVYFIWLLSDHKGIKNNELKCFFWLFFYTFLG